MPTLKEQAIPRIKAAFEASGCHPFMEEYKGKWYPLRYICSCGREHSVSWGNAIKKQKIHCPACTNTHSEYRQSLRASWVTALEEKARNQGVTNLQYTGYRDPLTYTCRCGQTRTGKSPVIVLSQDRNLECESCMLKRESHRKREIFSSLLEDKIKPFFQEHGVTLLTEEYEGEEQVLVFECIECSSLATTRWRYIRTGFPKHKQWCSPCFSKNWNGQRHPNWNPELSEEERYQRRSAELDVIWAKRVKELAGFRCDISGSLQGPFSSHHLYSYADNRDKRVELSNGVCIRRDLHLEFHKKYGFGNNTPQQYQEFKEWYSSSQS